MTAIGPLVLDNWEKQSVKRGSDDTNCISEHSHTIFYLHSKEVSKPLLINYKCNFDQNVLTHVIKQRHFWFLN